MRIDESIEIAAPREEVWSVVADMAGYRRFFRGITRWDRQNEREGLGARHLMRMRVGSAEVGSLIEVVECDPPRELAWTSVTGLDQRGRWRLREAGDGATRVSLRISYQAPGGLLSWVSDQVSAPIVRGNVRRSLEALKRLVERGAPGLAGEAEGGGLAQTAGQVAEAVVTFTRAGLVRPHRPDRLVRAAAALARFGASPAAGFIASAARDPERAAVIDELGRLSFAELDRRTNALAHSLSDHGVLEGDGVAVMCRNHRGFVEAIVALSKLGAHALLLNTAFAGPQLTGVVRREKPVGIVYDAEFAELLEQAGRRRKRFVAWHGDGDDPPDPTLDELIEAGDPAGVVAPAEPGRTIILTSGTTGTPKGASRGSPGAVGPLVAILSRIPLRARQATMIAAPLFHTWGFAHLQLGLALSSTYVLRRRFDPEGVLADVERTGASTLVVVPVMLQRILELPETVRRSHDTSSLSVVAVSGSALPGELAIRFMDEFGDVLYNLYGSTEVAWATIATPADLRAAPGTAGRPPPGTVVRILDEQGAELPPGRTGRIFVGNEMLFEGYTGGQTKDMIGGLMATGDVGRLDDAGRLFVEGRDDEMIVSGGENVFPREVEDVLSDLPGVAEVAVVGVEDDEFGQRLAAFVVPAGGRRLSEDDVRRHVKRNLAGFKVPRDVNFLDELPRNATGKVLKRELVEGG